MPAISPIPSNPPQPSQPLSEPLSAAAKIEPTHPLDPQVDSDRPGWPETIGPYRPLQILGQGGMGIVYMVERKAREHETGERKTPRGQRLALKLVRGLRHSSTALARFEVERRVMERLCHTNIARVYATGETAAGQPYFVMELIRGLPVTEYCDAHRLTIDQRLKLFKTICDAVHYAHRNGILHRDLKPSNILVAEIGGEPVPKIIDFGIAKALDSHPAGTAQLTRGNLIGTPVYICPESFRATGQASAPDLRTDVYALGVLLYELLTGLRPFETRGVPLIKIVHQMIQHAPPLPSQRLARLDVSTAAELLPEIAAQRRVSIGGLRKCLEGDLDLIATRAVARQRSRRYSSCAALAEAIGHRL